MSVAARSLLGGLAGLSFAGLAAAASPESPPPIFGPALIIAFGHELPILPAIFGALGVMMTRSFAPIAAVETRMGRSGRSALTGMMVLLMLGLVLSGERRPLVIVGIAGGLGFSGVAIFELLAGGVVSAARFVIDAFVRGASHILAGKKNDAD